MFPTYQHVVQEEPNSSHTYRQHGLQQELDGLRRYYNYPTSANHLPFNYEFYNTLPHFQYLSPNVFSQQEYYQRIRTAYSPFGSIGTDNRGKI